MDCMHICQLPIAHYYSTPYQTYGNWCAVRAWAQAFHIIISFLFVSISIHFFCFPSPIQHSFISSGCVSSQQSTQHGSPIDRNRWLMEDWKAIYRHVKCVSNCFSINFYYILCPSHFISLHRHCHRPSTDDHLYQICQKTITIIINKAS